MAKEKLKRYYFYAFPSIHKKFVKLLRWREDKKVSEKFREVEVEYVKKYEIKSPPPIT